MSFVILRQFILYLVSFNAAWETMCFNSISAAYWGKGNLIV